MICRLLNIVKLVLLVHIAVGLHVHVIVWAADQISPNNNPYTQQPQLHDVESRSTTSTKFEPGPNDELCILSKRHIQDKLYEYSDDNGSCCCGLCNPGYYLQSFCKCEAGTEIPSVVTVCVHVRQGEQYMPVANKCTQPYNCSRTCGSNQRQGAECTSTADITCKCEEGWYNPYPLEEATIPRECRAKPRCQAGDGLVKQTSNDGAEVNFTCKRCEEGTFQAKNSSLESCQRRRVCQVKAGSRFVDNVCLNDEPLSNSTHGSPGPPLASSAVRTEPTEKASSESPQFETSSPSPSPKNTEYPPCKTPKGDDTSKSTPAAPIPDGCHPAVYVFFLISLMLNVMLLVNLCHTKKQKTQPSAALPVSYRRAPNRENEGIVRQ